jgi:hypothetical protein
MATKKITKRSVDALMCPPGKDREVMWDSDLAGFGVVVMPSGTKTYIVQYRIGRQTRRMKMGKHGALTPDEARQRAKEVLGTWRGTRTRWRCGGQKGPNSLSACSLTLTCAFTSR